jgi:hypothetical protein
MHTDAACRFSAWGSRTLHPCAFLLIPAYLCSKPCLIGNRQEAGKQGPVEGFGSRPIKAARRQLAEQTAGSRRLGRQLWSVPLQRFHRTAAIGSVCPGPTDLRRHSRDRSVFTESLDTRSCLTRATVPR